MTRPETDRGHDQRLKVLSETPPNSNSGLSLNKSYNERFSDYSQYHDIPNDALRRPAAPDLGSDKIAEGVWWYDLGMTMQYDLYNEYPQLSTSHRLRRCRNIQ